MNLNYNITCFSFQDLPRMHRDEPDRTQTEDTIICLRNPVRMDFQPLIADAKKGVMITANKPNISCSDGKMYFWSGTTLIGPSGVSFCNVRSFEEAVGIVTGYYDGRMY